MVYAERYLFDDSNGWNEEQLQDEYQVQMLATLEQTIHATLNTADATQPVSSLPPRHTEYSSDSSDDTDYPSRRRLAKKPAAQVAKAETVEQEAPSFAFLKRLAAKKEDDDDVDKIEIEHDLPFVDLTEDSPPAKAVVDLTEEMPPLEGGTKAHFLQLRTMMKTHMY